jgi:hypothetical protein
MRENEPARTTPDEGAPPELLRDREVRKNINEALRRARNGSGRPGSTADDLLKLAREQSRLDA